MKKIKITIYFLGFIIALFPLKFGQLRYDQAIREIGIRMELDRDFGTDSDIEGVLSESGFPIGWDDSPTIGQFYVVGLKSIK
jgi:hypothetical protein